MHYKVKWFVCFKQVFSVVACWAEDPNSETLKFHLARIPDYFWLAEDGLKIQVTDHPAS